MATPNREQIMEKATELYHKQNMVCGTMTGINPTEQELKEDGFFQTAQQVLMYNPESLYGIVKEKKEEEETETLAKNGLEVDLEKLLESGCYVCGTSGSGKSHVVMYIVDMLLRQGVVVYVVDPSQDWMANSSINLACTVPETIKAPVYNSSTIYDTSQLGIKKQRAFTESLCKAIMQHAKKQKFEDRQQRVVVFEECQLVYPEGSFRTIRNDYSIQLASMGRNFKVRFIAFTPFSANVDKMLVKITGQRYFGWTCEKNDLEYLRGFLGEKVGILPTLKSGEFVYHAPQFGKLETISIEPHKSIIISQKPL